MATEEQAKSSPAEESEDQPRTETPEVSTEEAQDTHEVSTEETSDTPDVSTEEASDTHEVSTEEASDTSGDPAEQEEPEQERPEPSDDEPEQPEEQPEPAEEQADDATPKKAGEARLEGDGGEENRASDEEGTDEEPDENEDGDENEDEGEGEAKGEGEADQKEDPAQLEDDPEIQLQEEILKTAGVDIESQEISARMVGIVESLIFVSEKPIPVATLCRVLGERSTKRVKQAVSALQEMRRGSGVQIEEVAGGYQMRTNPRCAPWIRKLNPQKPVRLSRAALEALAIVAYRQPITRIEVDEIRGVDCGGVLRALLERGLIRILGKKQEPGRPLLYGTTKDFLAFFGLKNLSELPSLREFQELSEEQRKEAGIDDGDQQKLPDIDMGDVDQAAAGGENKPSFASLVEASRSKMGPSSDIDPDLEEALTDANEAARAARRVQKQIDQSENPEGEEEKKEGEADVDSDSSKTSGGPSSLDELARRKLRGSSTKEREGSSEPERDERDEQDERDESPAGGQSGQSEQPEPSTEKEAAEEPSAEEPEHEQLDQPEQSEPEEDAEEQPGEESEQEK